MNHLERIEAILNPLRKNPATRLDCKRFKLLLEFAFPDPENRKWWASELISAVVASQKRAPAAQFRDSITRAAKTNPNCGELIKSIEKITRLANGEQWRAYGLDGYVRERWRKASTIHLLPVLAYLYPDNVKTRLEPFFIKEGLFFEWDWNATEMASEAWKLEKSTLEELRREWLREFSAPSVLTEEL